LTIRIATSRKAYGQLVNSLAGATMALLPANDNTPESDNDAGDDAMLGEALRYFAKHGLRAAQCAAEEAGEALAVGDDDAHDWWMAICRTLDPRLADRMANEAALGA
jgi:hypothetical protein